jgi:hypothetical protein
MASSKTKHKRTPKSILKLPDLEQSKSAVLNSLTSPSSQRTYDHAIREFIEWYCSEPRLAFNKTDAVPNLLGAASLRINHHQLAARCSPEVGLRGCRLRSPQCRSRCGNSPGKGRQAIGCPRWQLAYCGARKAPSAEGERSEYSWQTRLCDARDSAGLRATPGGIDCFAS